LSRRPFPAGMASFSPAVALLLLLAALPIASDPRPAVNGGTGFWEPDLAAARRYAAGRPGDVSFAVVDLRSRPRGLRMSRTAPAANVIKAMLLAAYLRQRSVRGRRLPTDEKALLEPMIRSSDNAAGIQVAAMLAGNAVERLAQAARMRDFTSIWEPGWLGGQSQISARDQALFFFRYPHYLPKRHRHFARRLLASIVSWQRWGIDSVRPRGWRLYFKGGWGIEDDGIGTVNHQVAFLERGHCRIALAILTEHNPSPTDGIETQRGIAKRLLRGIHRAPCGTAKFSSTDPFTQSLPAPRARLQPRSRGRGEMPEDPSGSLLVDPAIDLF
jgi:hypothetical protein